MKLSEIRVVIRQKLYVGNYESLEPEVELSANLDDGDDPKKCFQQLHEMLQSAWAKQALTELSWIAARRKNNDTQLQDYMERTTETRKQIKTLI